MLMRIYNQRGLMLILLAGVVALGLFMHGPIPQFEYYNHFADQHAWLGLPLAQNVLSNLPFLLVGIVAFWYLCAKVCEGLDGEIYIWTSFISGHVIKHLFAGVACVQITWMLEKRRLIGVMHGS